MIRLIFIFVYILSLSNSAQAEDKEFVVGVTLPLSGPLAEYGIAVQNGIELFLEEQKQNKPGVRFVFEDDHYDPKTTLTAFNKLRAIDKIDLHFSWGTEPSLALAPLSEKLHFPLIAMTQHPKAGSGYHYVIRFVNPASDYQKVLGEFLSVSGYKKLVALKTQMSFTDILLEELKKNLNINQSLAVSAEFLSSENDFRQEILKLKKQKNNFDILGLYLLPPQINQFCRQAKELHFEPLIFGSTFFESSSVIKDSMACLEGGVFSHLAVTDDFEKKYLFRYGKSDQLSYAGNAFTFAEIVRDLFSGQGGKLSAEKILEKFSSLKERESVIGHMQYRQSLDDGNYFQFPIVVKKIEDGKIINIR